MIVRNKLGTGIMNHVAANVREARRRAGLTQDQLADLACISRNYIAQIETGRKKPAIKTLNFIAKATNSTVTDLLKGDEFIEKIKSEMLAKAKELNIAIADLLRS